MQLREIITGYSENRVNCISTLCGQNAEFLDVKAGGEYSCHCVLKHFEEKA
jgi:hypothetical protein